MQLSAKMKIKYIPVHHRLYFVMGAAGETYYPRWTAVLWRDGRHGRGQQAGAAGGGLRPAETAT